MALLLATLHAASAECTLACYARRYADLRPLCAPGGHNTTRWSEGPHCAWSKLQRHWKATGRAEGRTLCAASPKYTPPPTPREWLVFTYRRSGSRWFVDQLRSRSRHAVAAASEATLDKLPGCNRRLSARHVTPGTCDCELRQAFAKARRRAVSAGGAGVEPLVGFKLMVRSGTVAVARELGLILDFVCRRPVAVAFMWRRNVLRRIVSSLANAWADRQNLSSAGAQTPLPPDAPAPAATPRRQMHASHPKSEPELRLLRAFRPVVPARQLVNLIEREQQAQRELERVLRARSSCPPARQPLAFFYEDLIDGATGATAQWRRMLHTLGVHTLGVQRSNGDAAFGGEGERAAADGTRLRIIHGRQPTLDTVANPGEVKRALVGTPHEWMLHD